MSSSPNAPKLFKLRADAKFPPAIVSIFDGHYGIITEGAGCVEADVEAGLYIVQFKAGQLFEKQAVDVSADTAVEAKFFSIATLPARKLPLQRPLDLAECRLYVSADGEHGEAFLKSMAILDAARQNVAEFAAFSQAPDTSQERSLCLKPGQYLLRVEVEPGKSLEQTIFIPLGWQAQVFFRTDGGTMRETDVCRWMTNAAILLLPSEFEFIASDYAREEIEAALQNLVSNRPLASVSSSAKGQSRGNPMLDIITAHLWLRERAAGRAAFDKAVQDLGSTIPLHPDVISLKLCSDFPDPATIDFDLPPMLRNSWRIVVEQSLNTPTIVPANSWAALASHGMTGMRGWLVWRTPDSTQKLLEPAPALAGSLDDVRAKIAVLVRGKTDLELRKMLKDLDLTGVEGPLLTYLIGVVRTEDTALKLVESLYSSDFVGSIYRFLRRLLPSVNLVPKEKILETATKFIQTRSSEAYVVRSLEVPQATLRSALASLGPKLGSISTMPHGQS